MLCKAFTEGSQLEPKATVVAVLGWGGVAATDEQMETA